jgi:hypothetical protein
MFVFFTGKFSLPISNNKKNEKENGKWKIILVM